MICPVCSSKLTSTGVLNGIFKAENLYCNSCNSYHIASKIDDLEYYANQYHSAFNYKRIVSSIIYKMGLVSNRCISRFNYSKKYIPFYPKMNILEIGGGSGENFIVFNSSTKLNQYTIIEPNPDFNIKHRKLRYFNDVFENINHSLLSNSDLIIMFHVLEHIFDLDAFFQKLKEINPRYFYFEVPNIGHKVVLDDSLHNHPHYHHFSIQSIEKLFEKHGFKKISLEGINPVSYHPYQKIGMIRRYSRRIMGRNEVAHNQGLYIRGIYQIQNQ
jgi:hypothetical protein